MTIRIHRDLIQGSDAWLQARCGILTASEMCRIITAKALKPAKNDKASAHLYELLAQRFTGYVEPAYVSDDMLRGQADEIEARALYARHHSPVQEVGFVTRDFGGGVVVGCSPDGLVGDHGLIEIKSRRQKFQAETIISGAVPDEHVIQVQTALLVTGRAWCDFVSYCGGMPLAVIRVPADETAHHAILAAAGMFEADLAEKLAALRANAAGLLPTKRRIEQEMYGL